MPLAPDEYNVFRNIYFSQKPQLGDPMTPPFYKVKRFRKILKLLDHHDEYYSILNNDTLEVEWSHGVERVLGYTSEEWNEYLALAIIHDQFRDMYMRLGSLFYQVLYEGNLILKPLKHRYMINYPVQKKNGKYVWVKQMSMPLMLDANGRMVRQISSYMVICRYQGQGITLPTTPRVFDPEGNRMEAVERVVFKRFMDSLPLQLDPIHLKILQGFADIDRIKPEVEKEKYIQNGLPPVTHKEVAGRIKHKEAIVKKYSSEINRKMKEAFHRDFPNTYHIAMFLKGLRYIEPSVKILV
ncbi:MAG: hypothetical protein EPGJADBJ_04875 [Saprospiraceae bacterium]|nr:hypothetical protein [Saprospiraceae bacterium]